MSDHQAETGVLCQEFVDTGRCGHSDAEHDALADGERARLRVGFRYQDGEVLSPAREVLSEDDEIPIAVIDLGDGEWLTLDDLRAMHAERLEAALDSWGDEQISPPAPCGSAEHHAAHWMPCDSGCQPDWHKDGCAIYDKCPGIAFSPGQAGPS